MITCVTANDMHDALDKLEKWRLELEQTHSLGNLRRSAKMIQKYKKTKDAEIRDEAIIRLEFEIDWIASKQGKMLLQEGLTWTLVG